MGKISYKRTPALSSKEDHVNQEQRASLPSRVFQIQMSIMTHCSMPQPVLVFSSWPSRLSVPCPVSTRHERTIWTSLQLHVVEEKASLEHLGRDVLMRIEVRMFKTSGVSRYKQISDDLFAVERDGIWHSFLSSKIKTVYCVSRALQGLSLWMHRMSTLTIEQTYNTWPTGGTTSVKNFRLISVTRTSTSDHAFVRQISEELRTLCTHFLHDSLFIGLLCVVAI